MPDEVGSGRLRVGGRVRWRLLTEVAALQSLPQAGHALDRLHAAAKEVAGAAWWQLWRLGRTVAADWSGPVDPEMPRRDTGTLTTELGLEVGGRLVFTPASGVDLWLVEAATRHLLPRLEEAGDQETAATFASALALADFLVRRMGLVRHVPLQEPGDSDAPVRPPAGRHLRKLGLGLTVTSSELAAALGVDSLPRIDRLARNPRRGDEAPWCLVRRGETYLAALPAAIVPCAMQWVARELARSGRTGLWVAALQEAMVNSVAQSLARLGVLLVVEGMEDDEPEFDRMELIAQIDKDKVVHVIAINDDEEGLLSMGANPVWARDETVRALSARLTSVSEDLFAREGMNEVLRLIVLQGGSAPAQIKLRDDGLALTLVSSAWELDSIARSSEPDLLWLWRLAHLAAESGWRIDAPQPSLLELHALARMGRWQVDNLPRAEDLGSMVAPSGWAAALHRKQSEEEDLHVVRGTGAGADPVPVVRRMVDGQEPAVYVPADPVVFRRPAVLYEAHGLLLWFVPSTPGTFDDIRGHEGMDLWLNLVPFWLDKLSSLLPEWTRLIDGPWCITVMVTPPDSDDDLPVGQQWTMALPGPHAISLHIASRAPFSDASPDAEHRLVSDFISVLADCIGVTPPPGMLDRARRLMSGMRNIAIVNTDDRTVVPTGVPHREINAWALSGVRRRVADHLMSHHGPSPFSGTEWLNQAAIAAFGIFEKRVASLTPQGLLEQLVSFNEEHLHRQARLRYDLPMAGLSQGIDEALPQLMERSHGLFSDGVARRFVIEYVTAQPPSGLRPLSFSVYEELLAIAAVLTEFGAASDIVHHRLGEVRPVVTPRRSLWVAPVDYADGLEAFRGAALSDAAGDASWLHEPVASALPHGQDVQQLMRTLAEAFGFETGITLTQFRDAVDALLDSCPLEDSVHVVPRASLRQLLGALPGWDDAAVSSFLTRTTLEARDRFVPAGQRAREVYPWRSARDLSLIRRPLISRKSGTQDDILFGPRALLATWSNLIELLFAGRYPAAHPALKKAISSVQGLESRLFNDEVAELFAEFPDLHVVRRFKKIRARRLVDDQGDVGDVDVLVVDPGRRIVLCVETKRLAHAFMPHQVIHMLEDTFGTGGKRSSAVDRHLRRMRCVESHIAEVLEMVDAPDHAGWRIEGLIVTQQQMLGPHVRGCVLPVKSVDQLKRALAAGGLY